MGYEAEKEWTRHIVSGGGMAFPAEYVIRIFKGSYPRLNLDKAAYKGKRICDVGCGDGRNLVLLDQCGFELHGVEISDEIVNKVRANLERTGIRADIRTGNNARLPFDTDFFDYMLSWNSCYYMGKSMEFEKHVKEYARVMRKGGLLVLSIPKKSCFIYKGSEEHSKGYRVIRNDPFGVRNGELLRMFEDENDIRKTFSSHFGDFVFGSIEDDCFGLEYHWHLVACNKK